MNTAMGYGTVKNMEEMKEDVVLVPPIPSPVGRPLVLVTLNRKGVMALVDVPILLMNCTALQTNVASMEPSCAKTVDAFMRTGNVTTQMIVGTTVMK